VQQNLGHVLSLGFWLSDFIRWLSKPPKRPFFRCENSFEVGRFFLKSELFRCGKVQKGLIQPGRHLRKVFGLQLFRAVDGTHRILKMCYISNLGEKLIFAGHFYVTFGLNFTIFLKKFHFFQMQIFFTKIGGARRTMTAYGEKITMHGSDQTQREKRGWIKCCVQGWQRNRF